MNTENVIVLPCGHKFRMGEIDDICEALIEAHITTLTPTLDSAGRMAMARLEGALYRLWERKKKESN